MAPRLDPPLDLGVHFSAPIGVDVKGETWACVEVPGAPELLGTRASVRVDARVDGHPLRDISLMPTGAGELMLSLSAAVRAHIGKGIGDEVEVRLLRRLT